MAEGIEFKLIVKDDGTAKIKSFNDALGKTEKKTKKTNAAMKSWSTTLKGGLKNVGAMATNIAALAGVAGFTGLAVAIIKTGATFQKEMAIVKGVSRATAAEFKALTDMARKMGSETEFTATQSASALRFLSMAGFDATNSIDALPGVLDLATAGNIDLGRAADIASNALTAMNLKTSELGRVNDTFVATITRTNTNMEMMAESFKFAAPKAAAYGMDIETLSALIGQLGNAGVQGSMAGTQLAFAFGQTSKVLKGTTREGGDFIDALKLMNEQGWEVDEVMEAFGERGGRAALILRTLVPEVEKLKGELRGAEGEAKTLAGTMRDTLIGDFNTLKSTLEGVGLDIFTDKQDVLREALQDTTKWIRDNSDDLETFAEIVFDVAAAITIVSGKMVNLVSTLSNLKLASKE